MSFCKTNLWYNIKLILGLNELLMVFLMMFLFVSFFFLYYVKYIYLQDSSFSELEFWWTTIPLVLMLLLSYPTISILNSQSSISETPWMTLKMTGHQWYWDFEYIFSEAEYNSSVYMDNKYGKERLLGVDSTLILPSNVLIRVLVTSSDVIHSFFIPAFGLKIDAVPGRLSQDWMKSFYEGTVFAVCAELCGKGHSIMPCQIIFMSKESWVSLNLM